MATVSQKRREKQAKIIPIEFEAIMNAFPKPKNKTGVVHYLSKKHQLSERQIWKLLKQQ